jgi:two-component system sensor histidine kinase/response regulator
VKFTEQGEVLVRVVKQSETDGSITVRVLVSDTGIGVTPEAQTRIFQSFTQADGSMTRRYGGTGLGLSISKQLIELMGGQIGVESEPGRGSTFWFEITLDKQAPQPAGSVPPLEGLTLLLVTRHAALRQFLTQDLTGLGAAVRTAADPAGAGTEFAAAGQSLRACIVDLDLWTEHAGQISTMVRSDALGRVVPVVALVPQGGEAEGTVLIQKGIAATVVKPVRRRRLADCLRTVIFGEASESSVPAREGQEGAGNAADHPTAAPLRILLAEDNAVNRKVALQQLEKLGQCADIATNGREVLAAAARKHYDLILMDCQMPELDGFQTTRALRQAEAAAGRGRHAYIVAITANALVGDREQCLAAGMDDYLEKPVQIPKLRAALDRGRVHLQALSLPAAPAVSTPGDPVDFALLRELAADGGATPENPAIELIDLYLADSPALIQRMETALAAADREKFRLAAHSLKGSSVNLGARPLAALCLELENLARAPDQPLDSILLKSVTTEFERVKTALEAQRAAWLSQN